MASVQAGTEIGDVVSPFSWGDPAEIRFPSGRYGKMPSNPHQRPIQKFRTRRLHIGVRDRVRNRPIPHPRRRNSVPEGFRLQPCRFARCRPRRKPHQYWPEYGNGRKYGRGPPAGRTPSGSGGPPGVACAGSGPGRSPGGPGPPEVRPSSSARWRRWRPGWPVLPPGLDFLQAPDGFGPSVWTEGDDGLRKVVAEAVHGLQDPTVPGPLVPHHDVGGPGQGRRANGESIVSRSSPVFGA
jgi:hypothetical protein